MNFIGMKFFDAPFSCYFCIFNLFLVFSNRKKARFASISKVCRIL